jgi:hypothetical protein
MSDLLPEPTKRKRGAQPGNLNGLKHGLYLEGRSIRNTTPIERASLCDLNEIIHYVKRYIARLYIEGLNCKTIDQFNNTMHNISLASMALTRLLCVHNQFQNTSLPSDFVLTKRSNVINLVEHYKNKIASTLDLASLGLNLEGEGDLITLNHLDEEDGLACPGE